MSEKKKKTIHKLETRGFRSSELPILTYKDYKLMSMKDGAMYFGNNFQDPYDPIHGIIAEKHTRGGWMASAILYRDRLLDKHKSNDKLIKMLSDEGFVDEVLKSNKSLAQVLDENPDFKDELDGNSQLSELVTAFSSALDYISSKHVSHGNPDIGVQSRSRADEFAVSILPHIKEAAEEGVTTTRGIAERFNDLEIKSARGYDWTQTTIQQLKTRLKKLKLLGTEQSNDEPETPSMD